MTTIFEVTFSVIALGEGETGGLEEGETGGLGEGEIGRIGKMGRLKLVP
jgi:hypothetical protein